jgi:cytochrome c-type biogenesis protein
MLEIMFPVGLAFWFGVLTSISPCPLATNIAAISFLGKEGSYKKILLAGFLYTLGRALVYVSISILLVLSILSAPDISMWLQNYMNKLLGPILVFIGMILLELIDISFLNFGIKGGELQNRVARMGLLSGFFLGALFALSFCPISAALFFGSLIPISIEKQSVFLLPLTYAVGTAIPVIVFAALISLGAGKVKNVFNKLTKTEVYLRKGTGALFLLIGIYFILAYIFNVL